MVSRLLLRIHLLFSRFWFGLRIPDYWTEVYMGLVFDHCGIFAGRIIDREFFSREVFLNCAFFPFGNICWKFLAGVGWELLTIFIDILHGFLYFMFLYQPLMLWLFYLLIIDDKWGHRFHTFISAFSTYVGDQFSLDCFADCWFGCLAVILVIFFFKEGWVLVTDELVGAFEILGELLDTFGSVVLFKIILAEHEHLRFIINSYLDKQC